MFGIGEGELAIIVVFGFLLFGPDKLPQMGRTIGRAIRQFRETQEKMTAVVQSEIIDPVSEAASAPVKPKKAAATDDDSDADEDAAETAAPAKKETFAERRARLAAEKAASEAAPRARVLLRSPRPRAPSLPLSPLPPSSPNLLQSRSPSPSRQSPRRPTSTPVVPASARPSSTSSLASSRPRTTPLPPMPRREAMSNAYRTCAHAALRSLGRAPSPPDYRGRVGVCRRHRAVFRPRPWCSTSGRPYPLLCAGR
ncbi:MAG: twin-arginine translocase TatA/TatE family subunit [Collinsella sp.]